MMNAPIKRRAFLRAAGAVALSGVASPALAGIGKADFRSVSLHNLHTGEKLKADYWVDGAYVPNALASVNHVLRDYHNNQVHAIDPRLLDLLNYLHRQVESSAEYEVISGYRSPATNAAMHEHSAGVAAHSLHMKGMAIDIRLSDTQLNHLHDAALVMKLGGVGYYPALDFVHVDVGRVRRWNG